MKRTALKSLTVVALAVFAIATASTASAQRRRRPTVPPNAVSFLPASEAIATVDVRRLFNQTIPQVFGGDAAKLAQFNAELDKFKTKTGIDPRSFDRLVAGVRYNYPSPKLIKVESVAIVQGTFDGKALAAKAKEVAGDDYREERYRGRKISIITINGDLKLLGLWDVNVRELAACVLEPHTLAIGSPANVRAAINTGRTGLRANAALVTLARRDPNAVVGFGANLPAKLLDNVDFDNDQLMKDARSIKQVYGSMGTAENDFALLLIARTESPEAAKSLNETAMGLKQLGSILVMRINEPQLKALTQSALDNLKITIRGNELELSVRVAASSIASILNN